MGALPDELLLGAGPVGGRRPDTQHLLDGLQHSALAAAVLAGHEVDVGTACTTDQIRQVSTTIDRCCCEMTQMTAQLHT